jgi:hypothetical protein
LVRGLPVEVVEIDPGPELLELVARVVDVFDAVEDGFDDLDQPPLEAEGIVVLPKLHEGPGASAVLGRDDSPAARADRVAPRGLRRQGLLHPDVVLPPISEVVFVYEALANPKTKIAKADFTGVVGEAEAARIPDAVLATVDHEAVEVVVAPAEGELQGGVQVSDRAVAAYKDRRQIRGLMPRSTTRNWRTTGATGVGIP